MERLEYDRKYRFNDRIENWMSVLDNVLNTLSFCYALHELKIEEPIQRAKDFYIPILTKTTDVLAETTFEMYPNTAEAMRMSLKIYTDLLLSRIELLESK